MKSTAIIATAVTAMEIATPIGTKEAVSHFTIRELTYSVTAHRLDIDARCGCVHAEAYRQSS